MKLETIAVHTGHSVDRASGAVAEPITLSVTFERDGDGLYSRGYFYSSKGTPIAARLNQISRSDSSLSPNRRATEIASPSKVRTVSLVDP